MKREFLMLASKYDGIKTSPAGLAMSEKLDGVRCFWDGGITRGLLCTQVPFANTEKHDRFVGGGLEATGLWTRYGQPILAPEWFLNTLPLIQLDGELHCGRGNFQQTLSIVRSHASSDWSKITYSVFDIPRFDKIFADGQMTNINFKKKFESINSWINGRIQGSILVCHSFMAAQRELGERLVGLDRVVKRHEQIILPVGHHRAVAALQMRMAYILDQGGEGLMLRFPQSEWEPVRSKFLMKLKGTQDAEATVIGYKWGKSGVGTKLVGLMGSLIVSFRGKQFDLSGFTDAERMLLVHNQQLTEPSSYGSKHQGEVVNTSVATSVLFPVGSQVTFSYRELTNDGLPKEAKYLRPKMIV